MPFHSDNPPEARLVAAVLWQGCYDAVDPKFRRGLDKSRTPAQQAIDAHHRNIAIQNGTDGSDALGWVMSDDWRPFSFEWCCSMLDLSAQKLRDHILYRPADTMRKIKKQKLGRRKKLHD